MALKEYRAKRRFDVTAEPAGKEKPAAKRRKALIFVVQKHRATALHYGLSPRVEWGAAVPGGPQGLSPIRPSSGSRWRSRIT